MTKDAFPDTEPAQFKQDKLEERPARTEWYRIEAPHFCAAVKVRDAQVIDTAPILRWILMRRNRSLGWLLGYCSKQRWTIEQLA